MDECVLGSDVRNLNANHRIHAAIARDLDHNLLEDDPKRNAQLLKIEHRTGVRYRK
jgi:hypothetical protein